MYHCAWAWIQRLKKSEKKGRCIDDDHVQDCRGFFGDVDWELDVMGIDYYYRCLKDIHDITSVYRFESYTICF